MFSSMGFDAIRSSAENYAIKTGASKDQITDKNMDTMKKQLGAIGALAD